MKSLYTKLCPSESTDESSGSFFRGDIKRTTEWFGEVMPIFTDEREFDESFVTAVDCFPPPIWIGIQTVVQVREDLLEYFDGKFLLSGGIKKCRRRRRNTYLVGRFVCRMRWLLKTK